MSSVANTESVELLHQVVAGVASPVVVLDRRGMVVAVNTAYCSLLARAESDILGQQHVQLFSEQAALALTEHDTLALSAISATTTREAAELRSGMTVHALVTRSTVRGPNGNATYLVCTWLPQPVSGSTPPPANEPESRAAALGQLAGLLAHQIRNPLGAISNALALLRRQLPESSADITKEALSIAQEEVWVANRAISDLLEYSRIGPPNRTRTTARRVIDLAVQSEPSPDQPAANRTDTDHELFVDERQVADAIAKVIRHARENSGRHGVITFSSSATPGGVEIVIEIPAAAGQPVRPVASARNPAARGRRANQTSAIALGLTTAHALIANQGGRLDSTGGEEPPLRFKLSFPPGVP
ncbi:MAG TPA: histidine kinase dimerization/phospho-acceptor domain-containing protein [Polyangiaceae bacterium]|nr:histidine kinase dimerization/phospho-acceptor domain-containing protein [Polyangiaceae bacterium]